MNGLREIRAMNAAATDLPQTKRESNYRTQRDKLAQAVQRLLKGEPGAADFARKALAEAGHNAKA